MDITVYLPDELGARIDEAGLKDERGLLSRLFRDAVTAELERRAAMSATLQDAREHLLDLEDDQARSYTGRVVGVVIAGFGEHGKVILAEDERLLVYDPEHRGGDVWEVDNDDVEEQLRARLDDDEYVDAMNALGRKPIIDV